MITGSDDYYGQMFVDERVGAVFSFTCGVALGMNIGNFFQLQRTIHGNGIVNGASEKKKIFEAMKVVS